MKYIAPSRDAVDPQVFSRMPLAAWRDHAGLIEGRDWPSIEALNARLPAAARECFVAQTRELLADGLHYERRIAERGEIATRERNWHDLFNALVWLRHPALKRALNARQAAEVARMGPKTRSRAQCALTHFDEAGVIVVASDPALIAPWDAHDWHGLFWRERTAWQDGRAQLEVFGHALLEHALTPGKLLVGKALVFHSTQAMEVVLAHAAAAIAHGELLCDPLELRPLPLSGLPGWHPHSDDEAFHRHAACYQPRRTGRSYPPAVRLGHLGRAALV